MDIQTIVMTLVIPFIVGFLKKMSLPTKWSPVVAFGVALALVSLGKVFGLDMDVATLADTIIKSLAMAGVAVLGYDAVKVATKPDA